MMTLMFSYCQELNHECRDIIVQEFFSSSDLVLVRRDVLGILGDILKSVIRWRGKVRKDILGLTLRHRLFAHGSKGIKIEHTTVDISIRGCRFQPAHQRHACERWSRTSILFLIRGSETVEVQKPTSNLWRRLRRFKTAHERHACCLRSVQWTPILLFLGTSEAVKIKGSDISIRRWCAAFESTHQRHSIRHRRFSNRSFPRSFVGCEIIEIDAPRVDIVGRLASSETTGAHKGHTCRPWKTSDTISPDLQNISNPPCLSARVIYRHDIAPVFQDHQAQQGASVVFVGLCSAYHGRKLFISFVAGCI